MDLLRQAVIDTDAEQGAIQRLREVNIELIGQPLLVAKTHPRLAMKAAG
jgi:hypothetical protein